MGIITGTFGADNIRGTDGIDVILALAGDDTVIGGGGFDTIDGGDGNDTIYANTAANWSDGALNVLNGGAGDDTIYAGRGDTVNGGAGFDTLSLDLSGFGTQGVTMDFRAMTLLDVSGLLTLDIDGTELSGFEAIAALRGTDGDDVITLANRDKSGTTVQAYGGNDHIRSASGADSLFGGDGNDVLISSGGRDTVNGGAGNDRLVGGHGTDKLIGGDGADKFQFTSVGDSSSHIARSDTIMDFSHAEGDKIALNRIDAIAGTETNDRFHFIGSDAFSGAAGELRAFVQNGETYVAGDTNGDGAADFKIHLNGVVDLVAQDFIL